MRTEDLGVWDGNLTRSSLNMMIYSGIIFVIKIHNKRRQSVKLLTSAKRFANPWQRYIFIIDIINLAGPDSLFTV